MSKSSPTSSSKLTLVTEPLDYFRELVVSALQRQRVRTRPEIEFYLVHLLNQFMTADRLYARDADGGAKEEPLALLMKEAIEQPEPDAKKQLYRRVGDLSLYMAGYFQDSLSRKLVDVDYYIGMGGSAYRQVASMAGESSVAEMYGELAGGFGRFVDVLAEVSDRTTTTNEKDLLRQYELWIRTRSERAAKKLQEAGILPNETIRKGWQ
jgi:hypothetical protein